MKKFFRCTCIGTYFLDFLPVYNLQVYLLVSETLLINPVIKKYSLDSIEGKFLTFLLFSVLNFVKKEKKKG